MRRFMLILGLMAALLAACGGKGSEAESVAQPVPQAGEELPVAVAPEPVSPRPEARPGLPPTWTPVPAPEGVATPVVVGNVRLSGAVQSVHVVVEGDTLGDLSLRYDVSVADLARMNDIVDIDHIEVDWELAIPAP